MFKFKELRVTRTQPIDQFILYACQLSQKRVAQMRERGLLFVNDRPVLSNRKITAGAKVKVITLQQKPAQNIARVISSEDHYLAVDKKAPLVTERSDTLDSETLQAWVRAWLFKLNPKRFPYAQAVHRLDRETTGICLFASGKQKLTELQSEFEKRQVKKTYLALTVPGSDPGQDEEWTSQAPLLKTDEGVIVHPSGKPAKTSAICRAKSEKYWLWEVRPQTGRSHQIRVHFADKGLPLIGDEKYGGQKSQHLFLHAHELQLFKENKTFTSPVPEHFKQLMK